MKAAEVLQQYEAGIRDFSEVSLRGQNFKGKDLVDADFSGADIRSVNFAGANLAGANFEGAIAGSENFWITILLIFCFLISMPVAILLILLGISILATETLQGTQGSFITGTALLGVFITLSTIIIREVKRQAFGESWTVSWIALAASSLLWSIVSSMFGGDALLGSITGAGSTATAFVGQVGMIWGFTASWILLGKRAIPLLICLYCMSVAILYLVGISIGNLSSLESFSLSTTAMATVFCVASYVSRQAVTGDDKFAFVRRLSVAFSAIGGTSFKGSDLRNVNFSKATLIRADFRNSNLIGTYFQRSIGLDRARCGNTYLYDSAVRQLTITGIGDGQNFDGMDLEGISLKRATLKNSRFTVANLNYSNMQDADLSGAVLKQAQLDGADLSGATLTGAYIEDWGITTRTCLEGVHCDYVFMRLPSSNALDPNPRRKPDNWEENFEEGAFSEFIAPLVETLDLYHNRSVNPRALAVAFKELKAQHPEAELEVVSMERRGKSRDKLLLRVEASPHANFSDLSDEYFELYNQFQSLPPLAQQQLLIEKDNQIRRLEGLVSAAINKPTRSIVNHYNNEGDTIVSGYDSSYHKYDLSNAQFAGGFADTVQGDQVGGTINNAAAETSSLAEAAAEIQNLLKQLEASNPAATEADKTAYLNAMIPPQQRERFIGALRAASGAAIDEVPYGAVLKALVKGW